MSDNGSQFISEEFEDACLQWRAIHHTSVIYSPRQNQVERRNQQIKNKIRLQLLNQPHSHWDNELPQIIFALRNSLNQATQMVPSQSYFNQPTATPQVRPQIVFSEEDSEGSKSSTNEDFDA